MSDDVEDFDLDDAMLETLNEINSRESEEEEIEIPEEPESEEPQDKPERERDENGRFKKKESKEEPEDLIITGEEQEEPETPAPEEPEQDHRLKTPPSTWRAKAKAIWNDLPVDAREEILKRETDIGNGISGYKEKADYADRMQQIISPYMPTIQASGGNPEQVIQSLLNTAYQLRTASPQQKAQLLLQTAQQYGADMSVFGQQPAEGEQDFNQYLNPLTQRLQNIEQSIQQQQSFRQQAEYEAAANQVKTFAEERDEMGNLKHLYFDNVREAMAHLVSSAEAQGRQLSLEDAYDQAIWANPEIRSLILAEQQKRSEADRVQAQKQKAEEAKRKAGKNIPTGGAHNGTQRRDPNRSMEDDMRETLKEINSRSD